MGRRAASSGRSRSPRRPQAARAGIDPEIGEQAVERRDGGQHARRQPGVAHALDGLVAGGRVDARVAVQRDADGLSCENLRDDLLDDLVVRDPTALPGGVVPLESSRTRGFNRSTRSELTGSASR